MEKLNNKDFSDFQNHPTVALDHYRSMPKKNLEIVWKDVAPENKKEHDLSEKGDKQKAAKTLAALSNVKQVKYLAWIPETTETGDALYYDDQSLKGKYVCQYILDATKAKQDVKEITVGTN